MISHWSTNNFKWPPTGRSDFVDKYTGFLYMGSPFPSSQDWKQRVLLKMMSDVSFEGVDRSCSRFIQEIYTRVSLLGLLLLLLLRLLGCVLATTRATTSSPVIATKISSLLLWVEGLWYKILEFLYRDLVVSVLLVSPSAFPSGLFLCLAI